MARVFGYPGIDSLVWEATDRAPALDRVVAFDDEAGSIVFVDQRERPGRLDLREGTVTVEGGKAKLSSIGADGSTIYGVDAAGSLVRITPTGNWSFKPPHPARAVFPQTDGTVVLLASHRDSAVVWRLHPPEPKLLDTAELPEVQRTLRTQLGDRVYLASKKRLVGLRTRTLDTVPSVEFGTPVTAMAATPSGDRLFVATESSVELSVLDRYRDRIASRIELSGAPDDLRMDPLGRYVLVHEAKTDSAWVIALSSNQVIGRIRSRWRSDLPFVAPDGAIAVISENDVVFLDAETLKERRRAVGGAIDFWYTFMWTGFRPRAASLDTPVSVPPADTTDTATVPPVSAESTATQPPQTPRDSAPAPAVRGFVVSFAALLSEPRAKELAAQIRVRNENARVVTSVRDGTTIYRVVLGPFPTKDEAERVGKESGQSNWWVYEGVP